MESEIVSLPFPDVPFVAVAIASFDIVSGVKVGHRWLFSEDPLKVKLEDVFKMALCNVHRQNEKYFTECSISTTEMPQFDWYMINSIFYLTRKPRSAYFTIGVIMKASKIKNNPYFHDLLNTYMKIISDILRQSLIDKKSYSFLTPSIKAFTSNITQIVTCDIKNIPEYDYSEIDTSFLSLLLTSHLQTQMTTVIECQTQHEAKIIASFLAHFLMPTQREMSSLELHQKPIPGLFLQCVERQKTARNELMIKFQKPVTWVKLSDHTIEQTDIETQNLFEISQISSQYFFYSQTNTKSKVNQLFQKYKPVQVKTPAPWACATIQYIIQSPNSTQNMICDLQMSAIIRTSIAYVALVGEKEKLLQNESVLPNSQKEIIAKTLRLIGIEDIKIVRSIACLFDKKIPLKYVRQQKPGISKILELV
ncbi:hypothetical protein TRFO_20373 [Tritrichomonas foetus]|uniref:Uncharacterized protein n=1 Tax=Tritrichomonas foetus TaxID=1144522 RepID=A0A1J4KGQ7_9EUKA|nr:hypothetical protein TRFO_20373 [Tritrichomonas foetus]|eukprot:OHT10403.1 hypothetical protein TRFO_20373 [Tritrichomonas foetus]